MSQDYDAVVALMQQYFDGLYFSDTKRLRRVFHAQARYVCASEAELIDLGMAEYFAKVDQRPSPASRCEKRRDQITAIEFAGGNMAFVRAHCAIGQKYFTDFLTLIKTQDRWKIISKVFHYDLMNDSTEG